MKKNDCFLYNFFFKNLLSLQFFFILLFFQPIRNECDKKKPILKNGECIMDYCSEDDFKNNICSINNTIVKTQWLNNIIWIGDKFFRYVNLETYSNGDLVVETSSSEANPKRMFYGIKNNGRAFFEKNKETTNYYSIEVNSQQGNAGNGRYNSEICVVTINGGDDDGKEYLVSIGKSPGYIELYDFTNNKIYQKSSVSFLGNENDSIRGSTFIFISNGIYYSVFCYFSQNIGYYYLNKYEFSSININKSVPTYKYYYNMNVFSKSISCFVTDSNIFICFYTYINGFGYKYGYIKLWNENFEVLGGMDIGYVYSEEETYMQCIYYKGQTGIFVYYYFVNENNKKVTPQIPRILFKTYTCNPLGTICNLLDYSIHFTKIDLDKRVFNINVLLNDIIKINDIKICFIGTSNNMDMLYVVLLNIFGTQKVVIRYYDIDLYSLYHYKIFKEFRTHLYKNFVSFAFSFCNIDTCKEETDEHYSAFMIFSYANGTDYSLNVTDYLLRNNDITIDNIIISLKDNTFIENNIFGYEYLNIRLLNIENCSSIIFFSSIETSKIFVKNNYLEKNENIRLKFSNYNNIQNCIIKYEYIVTDPSYENDENYYTEKIGTDSETYYKRMYILEGQIIIL